MDESGFQEFLEKKRKSENTIKTSIDVAKEFESYLHPRNLSTDRISNKELELLIRESIDSKRMSKFLWSLSYYFLFIGRNDLLKTANDMRGRAIKKVRKPFKLREFRGIKPDHIEKLASLGIKDTQTLLEQGNNPTKRKELAKKTSIGIKNIEEIVRLSDLSRLPGVKGIRARLYYDAGFDSCKKLRESSEEQILEITRKFVEDTHFDGIAPLPKEVQFTIATAKKLPDIVEW